MILPTLGLEIVITAGVYNTATDLIDQIDLATLAAVKKSRPASKWHALAAAIGNWHSLPPYEVEQDRLLESCDFWSS